MTTAPVAATAPRQAQTWSARRPHAHRAAEVGMLILSLFVVLAFSVAVEVGMLEELTGDVWVIPALLFVIFFAVHVAIRYLAPAADPMLLPTVALLNGLGVAFLRRLDLGAVAPDERADLSPFSGLAGRQTLWTLVAAVGAIVLLALVRDHQALSRYAYTLGLVGIVLVLLPALLPAELSTVNGARLWIRFGDFSVQPGEFAKLTLLCFFAYYAVLKREALARTVWRRVPLPGYRYLMPLAGVWLLSLVVLIFENDLGTSVLYLGMFVVTLYIATDRWAWPVIGGILFAIGATFAWVVGQSAAGPFGSFAARIDIWLHPFDDAQGSGLQLVQSLLGLGTGGLFGQGPGRGLPFKFDLDRYVVPEVHNDFIFAGLGEEIGLFGLVGLLVAYLLLVARGMRAAIAVRDSFGKVLAGGLSFTLGLQVFVIIGGVTGLIPLTGQTTPYLSAGGSSLVANWLLLAMLLRIGDAARRAPAPQDNLRDARTEVIHR